MDFVPGKDLRMIMLEAQKKGTFLSERDVLTWANQLANALSYLHSQNPPILHRDIKPSNLKYTPGGILKLVDFGLVKILVSDEVTVTVVQGKGTAIYTPLEQYGGEAGHTDARSDIYSFGATLYHLLTNTPPVEAHERFLHPDSLIPPRQINPEISVRTERAILWALSLHPEDRPPDVETFRRALLGDVESTISSKVRLPPPTWLDLVSSPLEITLTILAVGIALLSLLLTLIR
jgi:serine/threonine-protein kinase